MATSRPSLITFDENNRIRIMDPTLFSQVEWVGAESGQFATKLGAFQEMVQQIIVLMQAQAQSIEQEKMQAIGLRNRAETETSLRQTRQHDLRAMIAHKTAELERYQDQLTSLEKLEQNQRFLLDKLSKAR